MNYIWEVLIKNENLGNDKKDIEFKYSETFSPYIEVNLENMNGEELPKEININPYIRYHEIFKNLFDPNNKINKEHIDLIYDLSLHVLGKIDIYMGMNKKEFYRKRIIRELEKGEFGEKIKENFNFMNPVEKNYISENLYKYHKNGNGINYFQKSVQDIFKNSSFYFNKEKKNEILIYMNNSNQEINKKKFECIQDLFLPIGFEAEAYWKTHFGILDRFTTMKIGKIKIY